MSKESLPLSGLSRSKRNFGSTEEAATSDREGGFKFIYIDPLKKMVLPDTEGTAVGMSSHTVTIEQQILPPNDDPVWESEELFAQMFPDEDSTAGNEAEVEQRTEKEDTLLEGLRFAYRVVEGMNIDPHDTRLIRLTEIQNGAWYGKMNQTAEKKIEPTIFETFQKLRFKGVMTTQGKRHVAYTFHGLVILTLALEPSTTDLWMSVGLKLRKKLLKRYITEVVESK